MPGRAKGPHPKQITAWVRMRETTLTQLAIDSGLSQSTCRVALSKPCYAGEQAIARFLGKPAQELWPDRYDPDGTPRHPRIRLRHDRTQRMRAPRPRKRAA